VRAWRLTDTGVTLDEATQPTGSQPGAHAIVRPTLSAIGASDVRTIRRDRFRGTLGHEFVGVIESIEGDRKEGDAPANLSIGQRVIASPTLPCGSCDLCLGGLSAHCRSLRVLGQLEADGCLAERVCIPLAALTAIPEGLDDEVAIFAQPLGAAMHAARLVALEAQSFVTVLGDGTLGLLAAQVMTRRNATVRMLTEQPALLELCAKWGIRHRETNLSGLRNDQDVVVECSGTADASAFGMVRPRGSVIQACPPAEPIDLTSAWASEIQLLCAHGCEIVEALYALARGTIQTAGMIDRTLGFDHAGDALALAARPGSLKIVIRHD